VARLVVGSVALVLALAVGVGACASGDGVTIGVDVESTATSGAVLPPPTVGGPPEYVTRTASVASAAEPVPHPSEPASIATVTVAPAASTAPPTSAVPTATAAPATQAPPTAAPTPAATDPPATAPPAPVAQIAAPPPDPACDPNYDPCVPIDSDVDCAGGRGNGPSYVRGPVHVIGRDVYGLDSDHDGVGCEG
jgi:hypothetical protein